MVSRGPGGLALVFPGQGSQKVGMGKTLAAACPEARAVFERADRVLGLPLSRTCFEGPEETLRLTATTQPAILATALAALAALRARAGEGWLAAVRCAAGHSLGEYAALVAAGALDLDDALRIVRRRGAYMQEAVPDGDGAMAAILGLPAGEVEALCSEAARGAVLAPANLNSPDQTVVAGAAAAVERLADLVRGRGAGRVVRLPVSAPFHCALMAPAQRRLAKDLSTLPLRDAAFPVVVNVTARPATRGAELRAALAEQVTAPVRWTETVRCFAAAGAGTQIEIGPGRVLSGLAKRIDPALRLWNVEDPASLERTARALAGGEERP
jgi:[acyl-carrier-protein] S-malonyltransferase